MLNSTEYVCYDCFEYYKNEKTFRMKRKYQKKCYVCGNKEDGVVVAKSLADDIALVNIRDIINRA